MADTIGTSRDKGFGGVRLGRPGHPSVGEHVKTKSIMAVMVPLLMFFSSNNCYSGNSLSQDETVDLIKETMVKNTSVSRKESYGYINFNKCLFEYKVSGTYPVGDLYNIKFSNMDFSSLNYELSKTGHDYTAFIILRFNNNITFKDDFKELTVNTIVVNTFDDAAAQTLFDAFLHLGELCGARKAAL
ncbi:hypothetical protein FO488_11950 [Geobacter sp. FeAm09]|uniref:hypothetical protein n=1 Tax=Geobacter sp. FeAm09 TaxID=2597769 RepID=UPI0011EEA035|nr:hypothetical protein [Geobacter sp. FeAm09]QEM68800.1 hypothetical protein FO488_11950 [Geobacter sp. FeAm09]